jgi:putative hydrolase of the HAD superfamily
VGKKLLTEIKAVGFDVDGTLYHSPLEMNTWIKRELVKRVAEQVGEEAREIEPEYWRRVGKFGSNTRTLQSFGLDGEIVFQRLWDELPVEKFIKKNPQLAEELEKLSKKYRLFLISNGTGRQIEKKLRFLGIEVRWFEPRIYCYDHNWVKPDPAPFLAALEQLNLSPEQTLYVGDREDSDIRGAQGVGMRAVYVGGKSELADISVGEILELFELV